MPFTTWLRGKQDHPEYGALQQRIEAERESETYHAYKMRVVGSVVSVREWLNYNHMQTKTSYWGMLEKAVVDWQLERKSGT